MYIVQIFKPGQGWVNSLVFYTTRRQAMAAAKATAAKYHATVRVAPQPPNKEGDI